MIVGFLSCTNSAKNNSKIEINETTSDIHIAYQNDIGLQVKELVDSFKLAHPTTNILLTPFSVDGAQSSGFFNSIDLVIYFAKQSPVNQTIAFANDEMVLAYTKQSKYNKAIKTNNWIDILLKPNVVFGRVLPDSQLVGFHSLLSIELIDNCCQREGVAKLIRKKNPYFSRPNEEQVIQLLKNQSIDYTFLYRSTAKNYQLLYLKLPEIMNLRNVAYMDEYIAIQSVINGPAKWENKFPLNYEVQLSKTSKNVEQSKVFLNFIQKNAQRILFQNGNKYNGEINLDED